MSGSGPLGIQVIDCWRPYSQEPVPAGDLILLAGSGPGGEREVLQALDSSSLQPRWSSTWADDESDELEGGLACADASGLVWQGLYARESRFALQAVGRDGLRHGVWTLEAADDYPLYGSDLTSKLIVAPAFCAAGLIATGWLYRHRQARTYVWDAAAGQLPHKLEGWPHALLPAALLLASPEHRAWECYDPATGILLWSLPLQDWAFFGRAQDPVSDAVNWLFLDLRGQAVRREREDAEEAYRCGVMSQQDYAYLLNSLPERPDRLELKRPADGSCLQAWELPGACLDARWAQGAPMALCRQPPGLVLWQPERSRALPALEAPAWLPPQSPGGEPFLMSPGQLLQLGPAGLSCHALPFTSQQARLDSVAYRAHSLLLTGTGSWLLRDGDRLWRSA